MRFFHEKFFLLYLEKSPNTCPKLLSPKIPVSLPKIVIFSNTKIERRIEK